MQIHEMCRRRAQYLKSTLMIVVALFLLAAALIPVTYSIAYHRGDRAGVADTLAAFNRLIENGDLIVARSASAESKNGTGVASQLDRDLAATNEVIARQTSEGIRKARQAADQAQRGN